MTYTIGDQVEGYVLTEQGWTPRLELDTSPFRPGHVVNDAILTEALQWQPLRTAPGAPYRVGDVVEGFVLVPSGDWLPLAGQVRDRSGAALQATGDRAEPPAQRTASVRTTQKQTRPRPKTQQPRAQASSPQPTSAQYRVGQVVNGNVLTADRGWVPLSQVQRQPARPATKRNDGAGRALLIAVALIVFALWRTFA